MASAAAKKIQTELVNFDTDGNVVVDKTSKASAKLVARRAIEAHLERKSLHLDDEWNLDD
ncbi:MAG: hypothetical protein RPR40_04525 [Bermanella sp.]